MGGHMYARELPSDQLEELHYTRRTFVYNLLRSREEVGRASFLIVYKAGSTNTYGYQYKVRKIHSRVDLHNLGTIK